MRKDGVRMTDTGAKLDGWGRMVRRLRPHCFFLPRASPGRRGALSSLRLRRALSLSPMAKEIPMKLASLALLTALALAGFATAQTPPQSAPPSSATAPAASSDSGKIDKACKKEIHELCGHAHGQEMTDCVKAGVDMNKFSASCKSEIAAHKSKS